MWFLESNTLQKFQAAIVEGTVVTAQQQADYVASLASNPEDSPRLLTVAGDVAQINIKGVITRDPDFFAMLFGGGNPTWADIEAALASAQQNDEVKEAVVRIESPGGHVMGMFDAIAAAQSFTKPIRVVASNVCASAAFAFACACGKIQATNRSTMIGSVGVMAKLRQDEDLITITSTEAPKKAPDVSTKEGQAVVREELDALHDLMVDSMASGRNITVDKINADFGRGATLLADDALKRGMIDSVAEVKLSVVPKAQTTASSGKPTEASNMDLKTLMAQHPEVYAAAVAEGATQERKRVIAHLNVGKQCGDIEIAVTAINDGADFGDPEVQSKYMTASMNRNDLQSQQDDNTQAAATAAAGQDPAPSTEAEVQAAADAVKEAGAKAIVANAMAGAGLMGGS